MPSIIVAHLQSSLDNSSTPVSGFGQLNQSRRTFGSLTLGIARRISLSSHFRDKQSIGHYHPGENCASFTRPFGSLTEISNSPPSARTSLASVLICMSS